MFHSHYELEAHMTETIRDRRADLQEQRLGQPSLVVVALAAAAGRVARAAAIIERWARGANEGAIAPISTTMTPSANR